MGATGAVIATPTLFVGVRNLVNHDWCYFRFLASPEMTLNDVLAEKTAFVNYKARNDDFTTFSTTPTLYPEVEVRISDFLNPTSPVS
jgi:hypothetical protein